MIDNQLTNMSDAEKVKKLQVCLRSALDWYKKALQEEKDWYEGYVCEIVDVAFTSVSHEELCDVLAILSGVTTPKKKL